MEQVYKADLCVVRDRADQDWWQAMNQIKDALDERHILNDRKSYIIKGGEQGAETV